ncbi:MAG: ABC transporter permease [Alphaproteobacteria bacterium]|nr:ABC transporter permease [Alphaproteobacteria bacterium]MCB9793558.1 ABC transporter permease [Alphaproteobacteria bacterium]
MPLLKLLAHIGGVAELTGRTLKAVLTPPFVELRLLVVQMDEAGIGSWSIAVLTAVFTGAVLALQFAHGLEPYGAAMYTGSMVSLGIVRELGPTLTAVLVGGRVGSGFCAEIGSMTVTEQVDAIAALGADPVRKLVVPRVVACVIMLPLLTILADVVGCFGGMLITVDQVGVTPRFYIQQVIDTIDLNDLLHGVAKSVFFGYFIAIIGCYVGLNTRGGTEGVGQSTTNSVVAISITVLVSNFLLSKLFLSIG